MGIDKETLKAQVLAKLHSLGYESYVVNTYEIIDSLIDEGYEDADEIVEIAVRYIAKRKKYEIEKKKVNENEEIQQAHIANRNQDQSRNISHGF